MIKCLKFLWAYSLNRLFLALEIVGRLCFNHGFISIKTDLSMCIKCIHLGLSVAQQRDQKRRINLNQKNHYDNFIMNRLYEMFTIDQKIYTIN